MKFCAFSLQSDYGFGTFSYFNINCFTVFKSVNNRDKSIGMCKQRATKCGNWDSVYLDVSRCLCRFVICHSKNSCCRMSVSFQVIPVDLLQQCTIILRPVLSSST